MKQSKIAILSMLALWAMGSSTPASANSAPVVSDVTASQRADASKLVDIHYDLADADSDPCTIWVSVSDNAGLSWHIPARTFSGEIGLGITPGTNKFIVWDAGADVPGGVGTFRVRVWADDGNGPAAKVLVPAGPFPYQDSQWVTVDSFMIDKYEVTNQFYCQFLNNADPNGDHWDSNQEISRHGEPGSYSYAVVPGKENYPIRHVNFYDAEAFAQWRRNLEGVTYRLPTHHEWEKGAAWDPVEQHYYTYGFQRDDIDCTWCVYDYCYGDSPMPVGYLNGEDGRNDAKSYHGCYDMSGNVWEWTSEVEDSGRVVRGGAWYDTTYCECASRGNSHAPSGRWNYLGFRLVLDLD